MGNSSGFLVTFKGRGVTLGLALLLAVMTVVDLAADEPVKKVLLIGIDGCRFDALQTAAAPHLDALCADGIHSPTALILGDRYRRNDTISGPGWSSILTGVWADKHGVHDNEFGGSKYDQFPHFFQHVKQSRPTARTASFVTWKPIHDRIVTDADVSRCWEEKAYDYVLYDSQAAAAAIDELTNQDPTAVFLYFGQVDVAGHSHGFHPAQPQYITAIENVDRHVGQVLDTVRARPDYQREDWLVIVTADHGGQGTGHGGGHDVPEILNSFLIVSGAAAARGEFAKQTYIVDAPVTALTHLGIAIDPAWQLDGRAVGLKP